MRIGTIAWIAVLCVCVVCAGCNGPEAECCLAQTETVVVYDNDTIPASIGISPGAHTEVDGYRFANILVEFEQKAAD
ncbi:MAG: hypothetical protein GTN93_03870, partial [Anaerolineae bacterium]|nr:hypothetical protein [Anaerolineae bacterium]